MASPSLKLNTISLQEFPSNKSGKNLNIIVQSAPHYKKIGTMLLNDKNGAIVEGIAMRCTPESIMTEIYEKWLQNNASWEDLIQCLKKCGLNVIAQDIEGGLGNVSGPDMTVLQKFKCKDGKEMNIIVQTAPNYKKIGTFLLNDENGQIVEGIARQLPFPLELTMTRIYEKWLLGGGTWEKLVKCLKDCGLNVLAGDIEDGLKRFSASQQSQSSIAQQPMLQAQTHGDDDTDEPGSGNGGENPYGGMLA